MRQATLISSSVVLNCNFRVLFFPTPEKNLG